MSFKVLGRNKKELGVLSEKNRIMIYGAGEWANDVYHLLKDSELKVDFFLVDDEYVGEGDKKKNGISITSKERLNPPYNPNDDGILWAIASPEKTKWGSRQKDTKYYMVWNHGFWKDKHFYDDKLNEYEKAREMLADDLSKKVMDAFTKAQKGDITDDIELCTDGTYFNELVDVDCEGAFIDCGSYNGESSTAYRKFKRKMCKVFAFEPDPINLKNIEETFKNDKDFMVIGKGCWSSTCTLSFSSKGDMSSALSEDGNIRVEVTTIDEVVGDEKVAFIKMDIEGSELEALKGAKKVIGRNMPILAISAYHRQEDFITLIPYIENIHSNGRRYKLYLRHHGCTSTELVLYGIPCEE